MIYNFMPFVTKDLQAAIMNKGRLSNNFLKNSRTNKNKILNKGIKELLSRFLENPKNIYIF